MGVGVFDVTSYAVSVKIGGVDYPAAQVIADINIRSGRQRQDDGLQPASATIELLEVDAGSVAIEIGAPLVVTVDASPRFTGRVSEVTRIPNGSEGTWTVIGVGNIRRLASLAIALPIPQESAAARAQRVITAAGFAAVISGGAGYTVAAYGTAGDPPTTADQVLGQVITDTGAVVQDLGDGGIMVQFEDGRLSEDRWTPDPALTQANLSFAQSDDVINDVRVDYVGGFANANDPSSIARFDRHSVGITTKLADLGSAQNRAGSIVARLAYPAWAIEEIATWDRGFFDHKIGALLDIAPLPEGSPVEEPWQGVLEGWVEHYQPATDGTQRVVGVFTLAIGDRAHSAESVHWGGVQPTTLQWRQVDPATAWYEAISNAALNP